jgi:hypothetical protein
MFSEWDLPWPVIVFDAGALFGSVERFLAPA